MNIKSANIQTNEVRQTMTKTRSIKIYSNYVRSKTSFSMTLCNNSKHDVTRVVIEHDSMFQLKHDYVMSNTPSIHNA